MNFNAVNVTMFGVGAVLIYCAIKDKSPKEVVQDAFTSGSSSSSATKPGKAGTPAAAHPGSSHSSPPSLHAPVTSN